MTSQENSRFIEAYKLMAERIQGMLKEKQEQIRPQIVHALEKAKEKAVALEELTREEAEEIAAYLARDLHDAAEFVEKNGAEFRDWFQMEVELIEDNILDALPPLVDETRIALDALAQQALKLGEWHTGEIVSPGVLECKHCQHQLHFTKTGHIPPCPTCNHTQFKRLTRE